MGATLGQEEEAQYHVVGDTPICNRLVCIIHVFPALDWPPERVWLQGAFGHVLRRGDQICHGSTGVVLN